MARLTKDNEGDDKNAELLRFIVANLNTKNTINISYSSLHNAFYGPENSTIESIEKLLHHCLKELQSDKGRL